MKKLLLLSAGILSFTAQLYAQTGISAAGTAPDASAMLDVIATDKGMLVPRVALVATNNSLLPIPSPADGLLVYNTGLGGLATKGFYYWDATNSLWQKIQSGSGNFVNGSGTQNYVTKWNNAAGTTIGNSQIFDNGTNVGINSATPNYKLDVAGLVGIDAPSGYGARLTVGQTATDYPANAGWGATWNANILLNALDRSSITFHDAGTSVGALSYQANLFSFDGAGSWGPVNLGINARSPLSRLHVSGGTPTGIGALPASTVQILENGAASNYLTFRNTVDNGTYSGIQFQDNNVGGYIAFRNYTGSGANDGTNGDYMVYGTYTDHIFQTGASETVNGKTEVMRIKQNGNVGIGNAAPGHQLSVGTATTDGQAVSIRGYSNSPANWKGGGAFGYTTAAVIMGELGGVAQLGGHNGTLGAWANLAINSAGGNVGIGNTGPTEKLEVSGAIKMPGASATDNNSPALVFVSDDDFLYDGEYLNHYAMGFHQFNDGAGLGGNTYASGYYGIDLFTGGAQRFRINNNGTVKINNLGNGSTTRIVVADLNGNLSATTAIGSGIVTGAGTLNYIPKWTPDGARLGNSLMYDNGTAVGIGTTAPLGKFHVAGTHANGVMVDGNDRPSIAATGNYPQMVLMAGVANGSHGPTIMLGSYDSGNSGNHKHWSIGTAGNGAAFLDIGYHGGTDLNPHAGIRNYNGSTFMTILNTGNVGIGTTNPVDKLDVRSAMSVNEIKFRNTDGTDNTDPYRLRKLQSSSNVNELRLDLNDDADERFTIYGNSCVGSGCGDYSTNLYHWFRTDGYAYHAGRLGVGNQSPNARLDISDNGGSDGIAMGQIHGDNTSTIQTYIDGQWANRASYASGCCNKLLLQPDIGEVGIRNTNPSFLLHLGGGSGNGIMIGNYNDQLGWNGSGGLPYFAIRFAGYRDVVSNFTGAMISGVRTNLCCSGLSQAMDLSFFVQPNTATVGGDGNLVERFRVDGAGVRSTAYNALSDKRLKSNIKTIDYGLLDIMKMNPVSYTQVIPKSFRADSALTGEKIESFGFIAQDLYQIVPGLVSKPEDPLNYWAVDYSKITPILVKAIQEQQKQIEALKSTSTLTSENTELKSEIADLRKLVLELQQKVNTK